MSRRTFNIDASDWHLSGVQSNNIPEVFDYVVDKYSLIKNKELIAINDRYIDDFLFILKQGGRRFLLEPLQYLQPKSFKVLNESASEYQHGFLWDSIIPAPHLPKTNFTSDAFFEVNGRLIFIDTPIWPDKYFGGDKRTEILPAVITNSWLKHGSGWGIGEQPLPSTAFRQLIGNPYNWYSIEEALLNYNPTSAKTHMLEIIKSKVPDVYVTHYNPHDGSPSEWCSMRCFLDTRPYDLAGNCGDQFFVVDSRTDKVVYHIHNGDVENLRILLPDAVGEAMDEYCAHTLLRTEGRFDFLPYSQIL